MTDAPVSVSGREFDERAGRALAPALVFIGYGVVKFFTLGTSLTYWPDTYLAVGGEIVSSLAVFVWGIVIWARPSFLRLLCVYAFVIPTLYSIYAIVYLGIYGVYFSIINSFSVLGILFGLLCIGLGYRMAYGLAALSAIRSTFGNDAT